MIVKWVLKARENLFYRYMSREVRESVPCRRSGPRGESSHVFLLNYKCNSHCLVCGLWPEGQKRLKGDHAVGFLNGKSEIDGT